jgi:hypothetical protein
MDDILSKGKEKPMAAPAKVDQARLLPIIGNIPTKSEALLHMFLQLPEREMAEFFSYGQDELKKLPAGRKGLRLYGVTGLKEGKIGGKEFHRVKKEFFFMVEGSMRMECEDVYGDKKEFIVDRSHGLYIPPFVMHTYTMLAPGSFLVVANTIFDRADKRTHDLYPMEVFRELQEHYL